MSRVAALPPQGEVHHAQRTSLPRLCTCNSGLLAPLRESLQKHYMYTYDGACKVLGLEATILAMRPHTPSSSHESCLFRLAKDEPPAQALPVRATQPALATQQPAQSLPAQAPQPALA